MKTVICMLLIATGKDTQMLLQCMYTVRFYQFVFRTELVTFFSRVMWYGEHLL